MLQVDCENWLARIIKYQAEGIDLSTPEILYISTDKIMPPEHARAFVTDANQNEKRENTLQLLQSGFFRDLEAEELQGIDPDYRGAILDVANRLAKYPTIFSSIAMTTIEGEIITAADSILLTREPRRFAKYFSELRDKNGAGKIIYAPGTADPLNLAMLCYFGIDLVDSLGTIVRSSLGQIIVHGRTISADSDEIDRISGFKKNPDFEDILIHNLRQLETELAIVRDAIRRGNLRHLVELRARHAPWMIEALRYADLAEYDRFERWVPVTGPEFMASGKESLWRPDIERYRRRIKERYVPPDSPEILVLLPCSAKKPYSFSRTHRMFRQSIRDSGMGSAVHEVIVTSPLGIVPRELETVYPAQQYDIPVTGHWDEDEKKIAIEMLSNLLARRKYSAIIAHLDIEMGFLGEILQDHAVVHTGGENVTSKENLTKLKDHLISLKESVNKPEWSKKTLEDLRGLASYQFGDAWPSLIEGANVKGSYPMFKLFRDGKQLAMFVPEKGGLSLTLEGGEALSTTKKYGVEIDDFSPKTNIFAIGVINASPEIRTGDEVYVHHQGDVRAVGNARMNSISMATLKRGEAVHIRHHR